MNSQEIYEELSSGAWIKRIIRQEAIHIGNKKDFDNLGERLAIHFQELWNLYHSTLTQEASEEEAERVRISEEIESCSKNGTDYDLLYKLNQYRNLGWSISKRTKKSMDIAGFLEDYGHVVPKEAFAVIKTKLPKDLKKELTKYESIVGGNVLDQTVQKRRLSPL